MKNLIYLFALTLALQANAQTNSFKEADACDLSGVLEVMPDPDQQKVVSDYSDFASCELYTCHTAAAASGVSSSLYDSINYDNWCTEARLHQTLFVGLVATDGTLNICRLNPDWPMKAVDTQKYQLVVSRTIQKTDAEITKELCTEVKKCFRNAKTPEQAAWATWKSTSLYCQ
jgi:hypothetical protein